MFISWWRKGIRRKDRQRLGSAQRRLGLEWLEDRCLLSSMIASESRLIPIISAVSDSIGKQPHQPVAQAAGMPSQSLIPPAEPAVLSGQKLPPVDPDKDSQTDAKNTSAGKLADTDDETPSLASEPQGHKQAKSAKIGHHAPITKKPHSRKLPPASVGKNSHSHTPTEPPGKSTNTHQKTPAPGTKPAHAPQPPTGAHSGPITENHGSPHNPPLTKPGKTTGIHTPTLSLPPKPVHGANQPAGTTIEAHSGSTTAGHSNTHNPPPTHSGPIAVEQSDTDDPPQAQAAKNSQMPQGRTMVLADGLTHGQELDINGRIGPRSDPIRESHASSHNSASEVSDNDADDQRMTTGKQPSVAGKAPYLASELTSGHDFRTSVNGEARTGSIKDMESNSGNQSHRSLTDTTGSSLHRGSEGGSAGALLQDHESAANALALQSIDSNSSIDTRLEQTDATDLFFRGVAEQANRPDSWQKATMATGTLLIADIASAGGNSAGQHARDISGPLAGLVFAWGLTHWPGHQRQQATIMLVESDDATRDAMTVMLVREGYFVLSVATARDAMNVLRTPLSPVDLVLLDLDLPDVSGVQLCQRMLELYPRLPVMITMGAAEPQAVSQLSNLGVQHYLRKPFEGEKLLAAVQALLR